MALPNFKRIFILLFNWERKGTDADSGQNRDHQESKTDEHAGYERAPVVLASPLLDPRAEETRYREHDRQYKDRQTATNFALVVFTAVTAGVGFWQGRLTQSTIDVNNRQAAASEESNRVARDSINSNLQQNRKILEASAAQTSSVLTEAARESRNVLGAMGKQQTLAYKQSVVAICRGAFDRLASR